MKSTRLIGAASISCGVALVLAGTALASDVSLDTTGPQSIQEVKLQNSNQFNTTNLNFAHVVNDNSQQASTGSVTADDNTTVGGLSSGNAHNSNSADTSVSINNSTPLSPGVGEGACATCGQGASSQPQPGSTGQGGSVLGASTGGMGGGSEAVLPEVGASVPVDVSALRAAWHAPVAPTAALVKQTQGVTAVMLLTAALLSVLGGIGSAAYGRRRERRV
jgi:hypothetical protein